MNFLAHYLISTRFQSPTLHLPAYVVGTALPDLLPLAADRVRLRPALVERQPTEMDQEIALRSGVLVHLATDTAFHRTAAFADAQAVAHDILRQTAFGGIRVRRFFLAHVLTELALDAVLLRADLAIADDFYAVFGNADFAAVTRWTETAIGAPLPELPDVLTRFARSRYLYQYAEDKGVATGLSLLCARAKQEPFEGENYQRLVGVVRKTTEALSDKAEALLRETAAAIQPPTTPK